MDLARPPEIAFESLKAEALQSPEGLDETFSLGLFQHPRSTYNCAVAIIACVGQRVLICFPAKAWDRKPSKRKVPQGALEKPLYICVSGCSGEDRSTATPDLNVNLWIGWLKEEFWNCISFDSVDDPEDTFVGSVGDQPCYPLAAALSAVGVEKFSVPVEQHVATGELDPPDRVAALEEKFLTLQAGLNELLTIHREQGEGGFASLPDVPPSPPPLVMGNPKRKPALRKPDTKVGVPPGLGELHNYPGMDPGTVAAALQAGVPKEHLDAMSSVLKDRPKKLDDYPRRPEPQGQPVTDSEDELFDQNEETAGEKSKEELDPVASALVKLTKIVSKLSKPKEDSWEDTLDMSGGGSVDGLGGSLGKKHAAVRRALQKAFREDPSKLWKTIEANMREDFQLQACAPNESSSSFSARGWAEHRSKIQGYPREVRWVWATAGALDSLRAGNIDQTRARLCLMLAAAEQEAIDHGNHLLSQEFSLEPPAPVSSFTSHVIPDPTEMAVTRLMDQRWVESLADRLKQVDSYVEIRRKLGQRQKPQGGSESETKGKGKGKKSKGKNNNALDPPAPDA